MEMVADAIVANTVDVVLRPARLALAVICHECCIDAGVPQDAAASRAWVSNP